MIAKRYWAIVLLVLLAATLAGCGRAQAPQPIPTPQAALARLKAGPKPEELTAAKSAMEKAAVALQLAQSEYDKIAWHDGIGATQQAVALQQASIDYESARANYEALVRGATVEELDMARAAVEAARAQVDVAQAGAGQAVCGLLQRHRPSSLALPRRGPSWQGDMLPQCQFTLGKS